jgi:hypothetical protein
VVVAGTGVVVEVVGAEVVVATAVVATAVVATAVVDETVRDRVAQEVANMATRATTVNRRASLRGWDRGKSRLLNARSN